MNLEQQREAIQAFTKKMIETIASKGDDYADEDRLSNFKDVAYITGLTPEMICFVLMAVKIVRLKQLLSGKTPKNEPMKDSLLDLSDYSFLLDCILDENNELQKPNNKNIATYVDNENARCL